MAYYRYRLLRPGRRFSSKEKAGMAVAAAVILAGAGHGAASAAHSAVPATVAAAPSGSGYTPATWAAAFIGALGDQDTPCNQAAIVAWEAAEGGNWDNTAQYNPLDTTMPEPGSWPMNSVGVQAYPAWQEGMQANLSAITNGLYGPVLSALQAGDSAQAVANAVGSSPWGTGYYEASC